MKLKNKLFSFLNKQKHNGLAFGIYCLLFFICFTSTFVINSFSDDSKMEVYAEIMAESSTSNTTTKSLNYNFKMTNSESEYASRSSLGSLVTQVNNLSRQSTASYFYSGRVIYYGGDEIFNFENLDNKYPTILVSNIFSYHLNSENTPVHDLFELKLMYASSNSNFRDYNCDNFCYITLNQADYLIESSPDLYSTYDDLINEPLVVTVNEEIYYWKIANIIIEGGDNEYYQQLYGDYVLAYTYTNYYVDFSFSFDFASSVNDNIRYLNNLSSFLDNSDFELFINDYNIIDKNSYTELFNTSTYLTSTGINNYAFVLVSCLILSLFFWTALIINELIMKKSKLLMLVSSICGFCMSYIVFWIVYNISIYNTIFFASTSIIINLIFEIVFCLIFLFVEYREKYKKKRWGVHDEYSI